MRLAAFIEIARAPKVDSLTLTAAQPGGVAGGRVGGGCDGNRRLNLFFVMQSFWWASDGEATLELIRTGSSPGLHLVSPSLSSSLSLSAALQVR